MGISDDIKPKRGHRTAHHHHAEHIFDDFDYDDKELFPDLKEPLPIKHSDSYRNKERLENDFFSHKDSPRESEIEEDDDEKDEREPEEKEPKHKKSRFGTVLIWLMVLGLLGLLGWQNRADIKSLVLEKVFKQKNTTSPIEATKTDDYYAGESSTNANVNANANTNTAIPTTSVAPTTIDKASVKIEILNGNGISNSGSALKTQLTTAGFTVSKTANAKNFNYATTLIYYKTGKSAEADLVKNSITGKEITLENNDTLAGAYDVVIVLGAK